MKKRDNREKKAAIRHEIKSRMQAELEVRKKEIKEHIRGEDIPVEEKRRKYRREAHEAKLRLMEQAKEEFAARKRMLGLTGEEEETGSEEIQLQSLSLPSDHDEENREEPQATARLQILEDDNAIKSGKYNVPEGRFIYTDEEDENKRHLYEEPINERDIEPPIAERSEERGAAEPEAVAEGIPEAGNLFYYVKNLFLHPVQALDEFDEYLASTRGILKVLLFYLASISPLIIYSIVAGSVAEYMPRGLVGAIISSAASVQVPIFLIIANEIIKLLIYSFSISAINYFVAGKAKFLTLTIYFAFVKGVTSFVVYTLVLLAVGGVIIIAAQPQLASLVAIIAALLLLAFIIWTFALNMIVLMSAYGYSLSIALLLSFAASFVSSVLTNIVINEFGLYI